MANKHMKKYSVSLAIKHIQIKMTPRFHLTPSEWLPSRRTKTNVVRMEEKEPLYTVGGNVN
jgi:hypothetical protein